jgi:hypothetical protein
LTGIPTTKYSRIKKEAGINIQHLFSTNMPSTLLNYQGIQDFGAYCGDRKVAIIETVAPSQG